MTLHLTPVVAKDGQAVPVAIPGGIDQHDTSGTGAGPNIPAAVIVDSTSAEILGTTAGAAVITDANGAIQQYLRGLVKLWIAGTLGVVVAARNALYATGASNSGLLTAAVSLQTTELNALANAALIISSVGGASGKFTNNDTGQAKVGEIFFFLGTVTTMSAGGSLSGWFLQSPDSGTTLESLTVVPPRPPDFIVPLDATTGNKTYKAAGPVKLPALQFKVLVQNNSGQAFTATLNTLKLAPIAELI